MLHRVKIEPNESSQCIGDAVFSLLIFRCARFGPKPARNRKIGLRQTGFGPKLARNCKIGLGQTVFGSELTPRHETKDRRSEKYFRRTGLGKIRFRQIRFGPELGRSLQNLPKLPKRNRFRPETECYQGRVQFIQGRPVQGQSHAETSR